MIVLLAQNNKNDIARIHQQARFATNRCNLSAIMAIMSSSGSISDITYALSCGLSVNLHVLKCHLYRVYFFLFTKVWDFTTSKDFTRSGLQTGEKFKNRSWRKGYSNGTNFGIYKERIRREFRNIKPTASAIRSTAQWMLSISGINRSTGKKFELKRSGNVNFYN